MAFYPSDAYRRNLEKIEGEVQTGPWRISTLHDLVSERRFSLFALKSRSVQELAPSVLHFRADTASSIAPATCPRALSVTVDDDRVEILTEHFVPISGREQRDDALRKIFRVVIETLALFERHHFHIGALFPEALGMNDRGEFYLLPTAYLLPFLKASDAAVTSTALRIDRRIHKSPHAFEPPDELESVRYHTALLANLITRICGDRSRRRPAAGGGSSFRATLTRTADRITTGEITTALSAYKSLFGRSLGRDYQRFSTPQRIALDDAKLETTVDRIVDAAATDGVVVLVRGDSPAGTSTLLKRAASLLEGSESHRVVYLDEWDLFGKSRKSSPGGAKAVGQTVWVIDDVDEKGFPYAEFSRAMLDSASFPKGSVILGVNDAALSDEVVDLFTRLRSQPGRACQEIRVDSGGARDAMGEYLETAVGFLGKDGKQGRGKTAGSNVAAFLKRLDVEERRMLEFIAVSRFALPIDLVLSVFPESAQRICTAINHLAALECVDIFYRQRPRKPIITLFLRARNPALRRAIYKGIPRGRRRKLHRTMVLLAEQDGSFPTYFKLYHSLEAGETRAAARHAVAYLMETKSDKRHPYLVSLCSDLVEKQLLRGMPFRDQVAAHYELALDLTKNGRTREAEKLLLESKELYDHAESDQKLKSAPLLSATFRLLAERWEERGEFKRALALLAALKDDLRSALSIPEEARLHNDIGWLQYRLGEYDASMDSCRLSLATLNANQYPMIVAQALNLMGVVHFNTSRYDEAISYYERSADLRQRAGDDNALAASFNNLALAYQSKGEYEKSLEYYNRSLDLKKRQQNMAGIAAGYLNLALLYLEGRNFKEAEARCRESLAISQQLNHAQLLTDNYVTLGDIALENDDYETAERHYQESYRIALELHAINEQMGALRRLSTISLRRDRLEEAGEYAALAVELAERIGSRYETAQIEEVLGDLEYARGRHTNALEHLEKAANQYTALSKYRQAAKILSKIGLIRAEAGNTFEARHCLDRANDFVRIDIGRELPEEFVKLQQLLKAQPWRTQRTSTDAQKLLSAFYDLSTLTDHAVDRHEFLRRTMEVTKKIADSTECFAALKTEYDRFMMINGQGDMEPAVTKEFESVFRHTLLVGGVVDSHSPEVTHALGDAKSKEENFVCVPLKAMSDDLGCLLIHLAPDRLPLSKEDVHFFTWVGREVAGNLKLMLHLNKDFLDQATEHGAEPSSEAKTRYRYENLIGKSEAMKRIFRTLEKIKGTDSGILILGESGTGKSALASAIHFNSPRATRPFQEIHCAQIPHNLLESELFGHERGAFTGAVQRKPGLCEIANGGTLFLDDINTIPVETQTKLLHFLESKSFMRLGGTQRLKSDVRIIAASNEDLEKLSDEGKFRQDLYYRLKVILIHLPPLRERPEDMLAIALDYIKRSCSEKNIPPKTLSPDAIQLLQKAPWRGNVRELQNVLERIVVLSDESIITPASLPEDFLSEVMGKSRQTHLRLDELADEIIKLGSYSEGSPLLPALEALLAKKMVTHVDGKSRAANLLGISKPTLYARLRDYDKMH